MKRYAPEQMELATRSTVSLAIGQEILEGRGVEGCVLLDLRHLGAARRAPGSPERQPNRLAAKLGEQNRLLVGVERHHVGRDLADTRQELAIDAARTDLVETGPAVAACAAAV